MAKTRRTSTALDGNAVRTQRTRARVLAESLRLFNERGEAHVTTGLIADSLDMSPGNLYYHFRNKDQIVEQLFALFEERIDVEPAPAGFPVEGPAALPAAKATAADAAAAIEDLWLYLHLMLEAVWDYRFLYRNLDDLLARNPRLQSHFNRIIDRKTEVVVALCDGLVRSRAMRATPAQIRTLARNVLVVATYWLNFQSVRGRRPGAHTEDLGLGAYQVMALVAPYLVGEARTHLEYLGRDYLD